MNDSRKVRFDTAGLSKADLRKATASKPDPTKPDISNSAILAVVGTIGTSLGGVIITNSLATGPFGSTDDGGMLFGTLILLVGTVCLLIALSRFLSHHEAQTVHLARIADELGRINRRAASKTVDTNREAGDRPDTAGDS